MSREDQFLCSGTLRWGWKSVLTDLEHQGISLEWVLVLFIALDWESWCPALLGHPVRSRGEKSRWAAVTPQADLTLTTENLETSKGILQEMLGARQKPLETQFVKRCRCWGLQLPSSELLPRLHYLPTRGSLIPMRQLSTTLAVYTQGQLGSRQFLIHQGICLAISNFSLSCFSRAAVRAAPEPD